MTDLPRWTFAVLVVAMGVPNGADPRSRPSALARKRRTIPTAPASSSAVLFATQQKLSASDRAATSSFGAAVALSADGNTALIGAYRASVETLNGAGAVYIYTRAGTTWTQEAKLWAGDKAADDHFGQSVALSADGNTALVGADHAAAGGPPGAGAAYVYTRTGAAWTQQQQFTASDRAAKSSFGQSVALSADGNTALVGAMNASPGGVSGAGAAYAYTRSGTTWTELQTLTASNKAVGDQLGQSVALSADGSTALVGAMNASPNFNSSAGAAYVYTRTGVTWTQQQQLTASNQISGSYLGASVALSADGNLALVGAPGAAPGNKANAGAAYTYTRAGVTWTQQQQLTASDKRSDDAFGRSVALSADGTRLLISAWLASSLDTSNAGAAYVYAREGSRWLEQRLMASDGLSGDLFGSAVALSEGGEAALIGALNAAPGSLIQAGAAYLFTASPSHGAQSPEGLRAPR